MAVNRRTFLLAAAGGAVAVTPAVAFARGVASAQTPDPLKLGLMMMIGNVRVYSREGGGGVSDLDQWNMMLTDTYREVGPIDHTTRWPRFPSPWFWDGDQWAVGLTPRACRGLRDDVFAAGDPYRGEQ